MSSDKGSPTNLSPKIDFEVIRQLDKLAQLQSYKQMT